MPAVAEEIALTVAAIAVEVDISEPAVVVEVALNKAAVAVDEDIYAIIISRSIFKCSIN